MGRIFGKYRVILYVKSFTDRFIIRRTDYLACVRIIIDVILVGYIVNGYVVASAFYTSASAFPTPAYISNLCHGHSPILGIKLLCIGGNSLKRKVNCPQYEDYTEYFHQRLYLSFIRTCAI